MGNEIKSSQVKSINIIKMSKENRCVDKRQPRRDCNALLISFHPSRISPLFTLETKQIENNPNPNLLHLSAGNFSLFSLTRGGSRLEFGLLSIRTIPRAKSGDLLANATRS
jgi:hypothetical protein